ncbi:MAG TPA: MFS transporter [Kofleriaceae bacterium]|nr:MFS transporter [Kofleriaceae bacterium]
MFDRIRGRISEVAAAAPRTYWYVWWGTLVNRLGGFVIPLLTIYLITVRHLSVSEAGGIISVFGAGSIAASQVGGYLADHLGRKITLVISLFGGALALAGLGFARELSSIVIMVGAVGFVGELYRPAVFAIVADVVPPGQRMQAYALLHWVINIGFAVAATVGGLLADVDFALLFVLDAVTMAIYGVIVLVAVPETRPAHPSSGPVAAVRRSRPWFTDRVFVVFVVITLGIGLLPVQATAPLAAHMTWQGFSPSAFGAVMAVNGVVIILVQPSLSAWCVRRDPTRVLIAAALLFGGGLALHGAASSLALHAVAVALWTFGEILESPMRSSIIAHLAPADARGRYQGAVVMTFGAAQLIGPKAGTWLWQHVGPSALWLSCLGLSAVVAAALAISGPARRRRMALG